MQPWKPLDSTLRVDVFLTLCVQCTGAIMQLSNALTRHRLLFCIVCRTVLSFCAELQADYEIHQINKILGFESALETQGAHDAVLGMPTLL